MPIYEYECQSCGHRVETMQKVSDPPLDACPVCQAKTMKRLISAPAFQFKGTGWYVTDYAKKGSRDNAAAKEGGGSAGDGAKQSSPEPSSPASESKSKERSSGPKSGESS